MKPARRRKSFGKRVESPHWASVADCGLNRLLRRDPRQTARRLLVCLCGSFLKQLMQMLLLRYFSRKHCIECVATPTVMFMNNIVFWSYFLIILTPIPFKKGLLIYRCHNLYCLQRVNFWPISQVIAATNRVDILDPALLRSGRLDRKIEFPHPNEEARARIMQIHSRYGNVKRLSNCYKSLCPSKS